MYSLYFLYNKTKSNKKGRTAYWGVPTIGAFRFNPEDLSVEQEEGLGVAFDKKHVY